MPKDNLKFQARGTSFFPLILNGTIVLVKPLTPASLQMGDLVLYLGNTGNMVATYFSKQLKPKLVIGKIISIVKKGEEKTINGKNVILMFCIAYVSSFFFVFYRIGCKLLSYLQKIKVYRNLMRYVFRDKIVYKIANHEEERVAHILHAFGPSFISLQPSPTHQQKQYHVIAKIKDIMVGRLALVYRETDPCPGWWIYGSYVKPLFRGLGIGEGLKREVFRILLENEKAKEVYLTVYENNWPALRLNEKLNFQRVNIPKIDTELKKKTLPKKPHMIIMRLRYCHS
jgi:ribosomal protein S18 acetylase RimI-like enzyme